MRFSLLFSFLLLACSNPDNPVDSGVPAAKVAVSDCNGDGQVDLTDALLGCSDGVESPPAEEAPPTEETPPAEESPPAEETPPAEESPPAEETPPAEESPPTEEVPPTEEPAACAGPPAEEPPHSMAQAVEGDCNGDGRVDLTDGLLGCSGGPSVTIIDNYDRTPAEGDRAVLEAFFLATGGNQWRIRDGWLSDAPLSAWEGVTTDANGRVTVLDLHQNGLSGTIPLELGQLTNLSILLLYGNQLSGTIPLELGQLTKLRRLSLGGNQLSGCIPPELGQLTNLEYLYLDDNQLSGSIPPALGQLTKLRDLWLQDNQLSGSIPPELGQLTKLRRLYFYGNQLSGSIPLELGQLTILKELLFGGNQLSGCIPPALLSVPRIGPKDLPVCTEDPSGTPPDNFDHLSGTPEGDRAVLEILFSTTGGNQWRIRDGWLSDEPLSAWAEVRTDHNGRVTALYLNANGLKGPIPPELGQLTKLRDLRLSDNWLSGTIPPELGQLTNLELLYLSGNQLRGPIPPELGQLTRLREFLFYRNSFSGCLPPALLNVPRLEPKDLPVCR